MRVFVVDDSALFVDALTGALVAEGLDVIGSAADGAQAVRRVTALAPDVVTMDVRMPGLDGLAAVEQIMRARPTPILVLTEDARAGVDAFVFDALARGAMDLRRKPVLFGGDGSEARALADVLRLLATVPAVHHVGRRAPTPRGDGGALRSTAARATGAAVVDAVKIVAVAASTGGPAALAALLGALPASTRAAYLVVQHLEPGFAPHFAGWLAHATGLVVRLARAGDAPAPGVVHVAPDGAHLVVDAAGRLAAQPPATRAVHVPSADALFTSLARARPLDSVGVVLTGMGTDGAQGLAALRAAGGRTFAQDAATSLVDGMPRAARDAGAVEQALPLPALADAIARAVRGGARG